MTDQKKPLWRPSVILAVILSWLGLAGLSDAFVEWKNWFEFGVMSHWRAVQSWLLQWVPFTFPLWVFDYLVLGVTYTRALFVVEDYWTLKAVRSALQDIIQRMPRRSRFWKVSFITFSFIFVVLLTIVCWPFALVMDTRKSVVARDDKVTRSIVLVFWGSIATFIPLLFVLTNEVVPSIRSH